MPLSHQAKAYLERQAASGAPPVSEMTPEEARAATRAQRVFGGEPVAVASVEDRLIPLKGHGIRVRIYKPDVGSQPPVLVWFHGGGWMRGDLESHDTLCRAITHGSGCAVVSVDYRLAPEHPFPAAVDDAVAVSKRIVAHSREWGLNAELLMVGGDSSGGNLAANVAQVAARGELQEIRLQILVYPALDGTMSGASWTDYATGYGLTSEAMAWYYDRYLNGHADRRDPRLSPLFAETVEGVAPALILGAECDCLRSDGELYAARLREAGVEVTIACYPGMIHGFVLLGAVMDQAKEAIDQICSEIKARVG